MNGSTQAEQLISKKTSLTTLSGTRIHNLAFITSALVTTSSVHVHAPVLKAGPLGVTCTVCVYTVQV